MRIGNVTAMAAAIAVAAFASSVSAQEFSLSPTATITGGTATFTGPSVGLSQTLSLTCAVSATLNVAGGTGSSTAPITGAGISPGNVFCGSLVFPVTPWSAATIAGQTVPTNGTNALVTVVVGANTVANDPCNPQPVQARLATTATGSTLTFNNVTLQAASGRADRVCRINGVLSSSTRVYVH